MHMCPVCGYGRLSEPSLNFTICPSCGTEFEYDDAFASHAQLRIAWLRGGAQWWSPVDPRPDNWDPYLQAGAVMSSLWALLRNPILGQQASSRFGDFINAQRRQSRLPVPEFLGTALKQGRTAQAAA
jgi:hypothetical protein